MHNIGYDMDNDDTTDFANSGQRYCIDMEKNCV